MATIRLLRRFQASRVEPLSRRREAAASHDVHCAAECCWSSSYRTCRVRPIPPLPHPFPGGPLWSSAVTGPRTTCAAGFILSCASFASRVPSRVRLPARSRYGRLPWGLVPHHDISTWSPLIDRFPTTCSTFHPQRFARSRRLAPPRTLRACFIAQPCPGFSLQGFVPTIQRLTSSVKPTLASLATLPTGCPAPANVASTSGSRSGP